MRATRAVLDFIVSRVLRFWQADEPDDERTLLAKFDELRRDGKLSFEEYREIQIALAERIQERGAERAAKKEKG